ncbi:hypothetical protein EGM85_11515 [Macrococcus caseolyticus]|nr:hypothetical protein [Macrococcus caseolyticus]RKO11347.1 hypothetical protein D6861_11515 [Macrococcus caseolyticus]
MASLATAYLSELIQHPVRTKALTSASFNALSEILAAAISGEKDPQTGAYIGSRVPKMALYGALVSGPLSHYLVELVQKAFKRSKRGWATNVAQIVVLNIFVNPILAATFITWMSILAGARTVTEIKDRLKGSMMSVLRSQWITSPILIAFAQKYVPKLAWTPVFSFFAFILSTYHNTLVRKRLAEAKKKDE